MSTTIAGRTKTYYVQYWDYLTKTWEYVMDNCCHALAFTSKLQRIRTIRKWMKEEPTEQFRAVDAYTESIVVKTYKPKMNYEKSS